MRVGSTVIGKICCALLQQKDFRILIDDKCLNDNILDIECIKNIIYDENIPVFLKSHQITPSKISEIFDSGIDLPIINVKRDLKDAWISRFFYSRYHRTIVDKDSPNDLLDTVTDINHLSDSEFMKLLCRHSLGKKWANEHLEFERDDIIKNNKNYLSVQYDDILNNPHSLCYKLSDFLKTDSSSSQIDWVVKENDFSRLSYLEEVNRKRNGSYKFFRNGKSNIWNDYLNEEDYKELLNF